MYTSENRYKERARKRDSIDVHRICYDLRPVHIVTTEMN